MFEYVGIPDSWVGSCFACAALRGPGRENRCDSNLHPDFLSKVVCQHMM